MKIVIRLTKDTLDQLHAGDVIEGAEEMGPVTSVRLTRDGYENAMVRCELMSDILGLPSTVTVFGPRYIVREDAEYGVFVEDREDNGRFLMDDVASAQKYADSLNR